MVVWVAHILHFDHQTLVAMSVQTLETWHAAAIAFHEDRLAERASLFREVFGETPETRSPQRRDPLADFTFSG